MRAAESTRVDKQEIVMIVIESNKHLLHKPDWSFRVGDFTFFTRDVPARVDRIRAKLKKSKGFQFKKAKSFPDSHIKSVHSYHNYLKKVCAQTKSSKVQHLPDIFPKGKLSKGVSMDSPFVMGYFCTSAVTPILKHTYLAAKGSVDCALTGAELLLNKKHREVYALCRPSGHHASSSTFGGYCYFNNVSVAANYLSKKAKVAILDIDYHHGDGTQEIFYDRSDVFTCSIHGDPAKDYPFVTGYKSEKGGKHAKASNLNLPLPLETKGTKYFEALKKAIRAINKFQPDYLVIAAGFDAYKGDPVGHFGLSTKDFYKIGEVLGALDISTLICQEGGYNLEGLAECSGQFLSGFIKARKI